MKDLLNIIALFLSIIFASINQIQIMLAIIFMAVFIYMFFFKNANRIK